MPNPQEEHNEMKESNNENNIISKSNIKILENGIEPKYSYDILIYLRKIKLVKLIFLD